MPGLLVAFFQFSSARRSKAWAVTRYTVHSSMGSAPRDK